MSSVAKVLLISAFAGLICWDDSHCGKQSYTSRDIKSSVERRLTDLNTRLGQIQFSGQHFAYEDIRVVAADERLFQFFHLPRGKVGTRATALVVVLAAAGVATVALLVLVTWQTTSGAQSQLCCTQRQTFCYLLTSDRSFGAKSTFPHSQ